MESLNLQLSTNAILLFFCDIGNGEGMQDNDDDNESIIENHLIGCSQRRR